MNNNCPCGKIYLTKGSKYSRNGLYLESISGDLSYKFDLVHDQDVELSSGRSFITSTPIITDNITIDSIAIKSENAIVLSDLLHIVIIIPSMIFKYLTAPDKSIKYTHLMSQKNTQKNKEKISSRVSSVPYNLNPKYL